MASDIDHRLRAALGDEPALEQGTSGAWVDGYGIVTPEVARYAAVLRGVPDAISLAMCTMASSDGVPVIDPDTANVLSMWARARQPQHVLEIGTGIGYTTLHLARAVTADCTLTSVDDDPVRQGQAHAFLQRADLTCAVELRLGEPMRVLREGPLRTTAWDVVVLSDASVPRIELLEVLAPRLDSGTLLAVPWALCGGRAADGTTDWPPDGDVAEQRRLNRYVATDPHFTDATLLTVGDGLLLAHIV